MKKPKLSNALDEGLKENSKKDIKRRIIVNLFFVVMIVGFALLAKIYIFKGADIKLSDETRKSPDEKIENQPAAGSSTTTSTTKVPDPNPAPTTTAAPASQGYTLYTVKNGDTYSTIANGNGMTSKQLMDYNGVSDPNSLREGDQIKIPKP